MNYPVKLKRLPILLVLLLFTGCSIFSPDFSPPKPAGQLIPVPGEGLLDEPDQPLITAHFTDPYRKTGSRPDLAVVAAIDSARERVLVAMYNFSLENVTHALLRAHKRGVAVQLVINQSALNNQQVRRLIQAGIDVRSDNRPVAMHHKFLVIDNHEVWTGSLNLTYGGTFNDHNHIVRLMDARINQNYQVEFMEMFESGLFGSDSPRNTPFPVISRDGVILEVYFSPDDGVLEQILKLVEGSQESVLFLAFSLTSDPLADALLSLAERGVLVRGVFDESQVKSNIGGDYERLKLAGLDVRRDGLDGLMHHKAIIVDNQAVLFGSYNFSNNAEYRNDENVVIAYSPELALQFTEEFELIYANSIP